MGTLLSILFIGGIVGLLMVIGIFACIPLAAIMYIWRSIYPLIKGMAVWTSRGKNYFPFIAIVVILIGNIILFFILTLKVHVLFALLLLPFLFLMVLFEIPLLLGTLVWALRLLGWIFALWQAMIFRFIGPTLSEWKSWLIVNYLRLRIWLEGPVKTVPSVARVGVRTHKTATAPPTSRVISTSKTTTTRPAQTMAKPTIKQAPTKKTAMSRLGERITPYLEAYRFGGKESKPKNPTDDTPPSSSKPDSSSQSSNTTVTESKSSGGASTATISSQQQDKDTTMSTQSEPTSITKPDIDSTSQQYVLPPVEITPIAPATPATPSMPPSTDQPDLDAAMVGVELSKRDKLMMKMMTNPVVIKVFSNPIVVKSMTKMATMYIAFSTRPKKEKKPKKKKIRLDMK